MALQDYDVFSRCHPAVNFLFFAAAIVLTVVLFHPAYLLVSLVCGGAYYAALRRSRCGKTLGFLLLVVNLCSLHTLGIPLTAPIAPWQSGALRDTFWRIGWRRLGQEDYNISSARQCEGEADR